MKIVRESDRTGDRSPVNRDEWPATVTRGPPVVLQSVYILNVRRRSRYHLLICRITTALRTEPAVALMTYRPM